MYFFNFAWSGHSNLTNGDINDQLESAYYSSEAVKIAKKIGCSKFVNVGTLEETFAENHLKNSKRSSFETSQFNYTIAKLASRDMCKITAYLEKIDYIHTRLSLPLDQTLSRGSYVSRTLKNIKKKITYIKPKNKRLFDIIFLDDVSRAYYLIGKYGKDKSDYFIGTSKPVLLGILSDFKKIINGQC